MELYFTHITVFISFTSFLIILVTPVQNGQNSIDQVSVPLKTLMDVTQECPRLQALGTKLLNDREFCDINLEVNDPNTGQKRIFCAHKCILCLRSDKLKEKIKTIVTNGPSKPVLKLPNMNTEVFKNILRFIYTDKIDSYFDLKHNILDLYSIADFMGLMDLKLMVEQYFHSVHIHDLGYYLQWAKKHKLVKIRVLILDFTRNSLNMSRTDWNEFMESLCFSTGYVQAQSTETTAQLEDNELKFECQEMFYSCTKNDDCCSNYCMVRPEWGEGLCQPSYADRAKSGNN